MRRCEDVKMFEDVASQTPLLEEPFAQRRSRIMHETLEWKHEYMYECMNEWLHEWIDECEWINEWINEGRKERTNEWTNQWTNDSVNPWSKKSMKQRNNDSVNQWCSEPMMQWTNDPSNQRIDEPVNQRISETVNPLINEPKTQKTLNAQTIALSEWVSEWVSERTSERASERARYFFVELLLHAAWYGSSITRVSSTKLVSSRSLVSAMATCMTGKTDKPAWSRSCISHGSASSHQPQLYLYLFCHFLFGLRYLLF